MSDRAGMMRELVLMVIVVLGTSLAFDGEQQEMDNNIRDDNPTWALRVKAPTGRTEDLAAISKEHSNMLQRQEALMFEVKEDMRILKVSLKNLGEKLLQLDSRPVPVPAVQQLERELAREKDEIAAAHAQLEDAYKKNQDRLEVAEAKLKELEEQIAQMVVENQLKEDPFNFHKALGLEEPDKLWPMGSEPVLRSCHDLVEVGWEIKPGFYRIDPDGESQGTSPFKVYCNSKGETVVGHDLLEGKLQLNHCSGGCAGVRSIVYNATEEQVLQLVAASGQCQQKVIYRCLGAPLHTAGGTPKVWWEDAKGVKRSYWNGTGVTDDNPSGTGTGTGSSSRGSDDDDESDSYCACGQTSTCADPLRMCNCDASAPEWLEDAGTLTNLDSLPVRKFAFHGLRFSAQDAEISLGPLICSGRREREPPKSIKSCRDVKLSGHRNSGYFVVESTREDRYDLVYCNLRLGPLQDGFQVPTGVTLGGPTTTTASSSSAVASSSTGDREPISGPPSVVGSGSNVKAVIFDVIRDRHLFDHGFITYTVMEVNVGGGMDNGTGVFTAPVTGIYEFSFHAWNNLPMASDIYVYRNEKKIIGRSFSFSVGVYGTVFKTALNAGDQVATALVRGSIFGDSGKLTRFSGQLLHAVAER